MPKDQWQRHPRPIPWYRRRAKTQTAKKPRKLVSPRPSGLDRETEILIFTMTDAQLIEAGVEISKTSPGSELHLYMRDQWRKRQQCYRITEILQRSISNGMAGKRRE